MDKMRKDARVALGRIIKLINIRVKNAAEAEKAGGDLAKTVKNDELIKLANFIAGICEEEKAKEAVGENEDKDIRFVLDDKLGKWAE